MQFQNPDFLYALPAMLIPVVVHLFSFRRYRKVFFSNVRMLEAIRVETRRQSKLRHLLVLAARMLAIGALVVAFARPYFPSRGAQIQKGKNTVVNIFIDNSFSMANEGARGMLFEQARIKAVEMIAAWPPTTRFRVLTQDFSYRSEQLMSQEQARQYISGLELSPASHTLSQVIVRQQAALNHADRNLSFIFSDFQKGFADLDHLPDSTLSITLIPLPPATTANVTIDTCLFGSPALQIGRPLQLKALITNHGPEDIENLPVRLLINGQQKTTLNLNIAAGATAEADMTFMLTEPGFYRAVVETDDQPISFDNRYYLAFKLTDIINVLHITSGPPARWIRSLFDGDSSIRLQELPFRELDYSVIPGQHFIIADGLDQIPDGLIAALKDFTLEGGSLWVSPPDAGNIDDLNKLLTGLGVTSLLPADTLSMRIDNINRQADLYRGIFESVPQNANLPVVRTHYPLTQSKDIHPTLLLSLQNSDALLTSQTAGDGTVYLFTAPLSPAGGNFIRHNLMVPTFYSAAFLSQKPGRLSYTVMQDATIRLTQSTGEGQLEITGTEANDRHIPPTRITARTTDVFTGSDITNAGFYNLTENNTVLVPLAFNYKRTESEPACQTAEELKSAAEASRYRNIAVMTNPELPAQAIVAQTSDEQGVWKFFILAVLLFLAFEVILLRLPDRFLSNRKTTGQ